MLWKSNVTEGCFVLIPSKMFFILSSYSNGKVMRIYSFSGGGASPMIAGGNFLEDQGCRGSRLGEAITYTG